MQKRDGRPSLVPKDKGIAEEAMATLGIPLQRLVRGADGHDDEPGQDGGAFPGVQRDQPVRFDLGPPHGLGAARPRHHEAQGRMPSRERRQGSGVHVVGVVVGHENEVDRAQPLDVDRRRHQPLMRRRGAAILLGERVGEIGVDQQAQATRLDHEASLAEPVHHDLRSRVGDEARRQRPGKAALDDLSRHCWRPGLAGVSSSTSYPALPTFAAMRAIASNAGPAVGISIPNTSAMTCVQPWMK